MWLRQTIADGPAGGDSVPASADQLAHEQLPRPEGGAAHRAAPEVHRSLLPLVSWSPAPAPLAHPPSPAWSGLADLPSADLPTRPAARPALQLRPKNRASSPVHHSSCRHLRLANMRLSRLGFGALSSLESLDLRCHSWPLGKTFLDTLPANKTSERKTVASNVAAERLTDPVTRKSISNGILAPLCSVMKFNISKHAVQVGICGLMHRLQWRCLGCIVAAAATSRWRQHGLGGQ